MRTLSEFGFTPKALAGRRLVLGAGLCLTCLLVLGLFAPQDCQADAYNVSGTFGTGIGPLSGGTFSGTFDATLPVSGFESIATFNIDLISASGVTLADLTNATAFVDALPGSDCSGNVACDLFVFETSSAVLELTTPAGFTGGAVNPFSSALALANSFAFATVGGNPTTSGVTSGSIGPTPEPPTLALMGIALLLCGVLFRRRAWATL